jgi:hypothetical protein
MTRVIPHTLHAAAAVAILVGIATGLAAGEWRATIFLVGVGLAQAALTASTRWSVPAGA